MAKIPEEQSLTPEQAFERLQVWYGMQQQLATLQPAEVLARKTIAGFYFPNPEEGTNRFPIGGGFELKLIHKINRKVDEAALLQVTAAQVKALNLPMGDLFEQKWELRTGAYRTLNDAQRKFVDALLEINEGTPSVEIVPVANREGQAAHANAADAAAAANAPKYDINTGEEADTTPGQYFKDSEGVWWVLDSDEWLEIENLKTLEELEAQIAKPAKKPRKPRAKKS